MRIPSIVGLLGVAIIAGCAGEITSVPFASEIELGTGDTSFEPLGDGAELGVVLGVQGGYHVVGNARLGGYVPETVFEHGLQFSVTTDDGVALNLGDGWVRSGVLEEADGAYVCERGHHILVDATPEEMDGQGATFSVEMIADDGEVITDARHVTLVVRP